MTEELKQNPNAGFYTLTIDDEHYKKLSKECKSKDENTIATYALRMFLERIRKKLKKSMKHWCVTELGHDKSERLHLHGIFWGCGIESIIRGKSSKTSIGDSIITKRRSRARLNRRRQLQHRKKDPKRSREFLLRHDNK